MQSRDADYYHKAPDPNELGDGLYTGSPSGVRLKRGGSPWMWAVDRVYYPRYWLNLAARLWESTWIMDMFHPSPLHSLVAVASAFGLPFRSSYV